MKRIVFLLIFFNSALYSMEGDGVKRVFPVISQKERPLGYSYYPFAALLTATAIKCAFFGTPFYSLWWIAKKIVPSRCKAYEEKLKKCMTTHFIIRGNVVRKKEPSKVVLIGYSVAGVALYFFFGYVKNIYGRYYLKTLTTQIDTIYNACNKQENTFFFYLTASIHGKVRETVYEEKKYLFKNIAAATAAQMNEDCYTKKYTERLSTREYGKVLVHDVIAEQEEGESFCIDFEEKNYDSLDEEHKEKLQFASFFTFFLLHFPFLKKFILKYYYLQNMNQKLTIATKDPCKQFSLFCMKKKSKKTYPFLLVTYQGNAISSMTPYFSSHIDSVLKKYLKQPYYAIHTRKYFLNDTSKSILSEKKDDIVVDEQ